MHAQNKAKGCDKGCNNKSPNPAKFIIPSLIGVILFMIPVPYGDSLTIPVAILAKLFVHGLGDFAKPLIVGLICFSAIVSTYTFVMCRFMGKKWVDKNTLFAKLFNITLGWYITRMVGAILVVLTALQIGPEALRNGDTGGTVLDGLLPTLLAVFLFAGMLLPLLINFGLLEFVGTLMTRVMRPLFTLPGRSAIDSLASWLGDGSVGIMLTNKQYENGHYTAREGIVVATTFSTVSITFSIVVLAQVKLEDMFLPFYFAICLAGFVAAIITPRIPPLSMFKDVYIDGRVKEKDEETIPAGKNLIGWAWEQAVLRGNNAMRPAEVVRQGLHNVADLWVGVLPVIMAVGTIALVVATTTPALGWLGAPFIPLLELLQIPYAQEASKTLLLGFADMFVPSILISSVQADITRFVIAGVSVTQLIYLSEVGALILGGKLPIKLWQLFIVFLIRTLITLPVICGVAHIFF